MPRSRSSSPRRGEEEGGSRGPVVSFFAGFGERVRDFATAPLSTVFASDKRLASSEEGGGGASAAREAAGAAWWRVGHWSADDEHLVESAPADFGGGEHAHAVQAAEQTPAPARDDSIPAAREGGLQLPSTWRFFRSEESTRVVYSRPRRRAPAAEGAEGREPPREGWGGGLGRLSSPSRRGDKSSSAGSLRADAATAHAPTATAQAAAPAEAPAPATPESDAASTSEQRRRQQRPPPSPEHRGRPSPAQYLAGLPPPRAAGPMVIDIIPFWMSLASFER